MPSSTPRLIINCSRPLCLQSLLLFVLLVLTGTNSQAATCPDPLTVMGGDKWQNLAIMQWQSNGQNFEPAQTFRAGAAGLHVSDDELQGEWNPATFSGELDWRVNTHFPFPGTWQYHESISAKSRLSGSDGFRPSASGKLAANRRHARGMRMLQRFPALVLLHGQYERGDNLCSISVDHPSGNWRFWLEASTGLPRRGMLLESDPLRGEVQSIMYYTDWREIDGLQVATQLELKIDNQRIRRERISNFTTISAPQTPAAPDETTLARMAGTDVADWARSRAHWFLRRIAAGAPADGDSAGEVKLLEITPDVFQVGGGSHNNLVIVGRANLIVVDAPWDQRRSKVVIKALQERWPDKPISHLILTHHHHDHSAGVMAYVEIGATVVMSVPSRHYFGTFFAKSGRRNIANKAVSDDFRLNAYGEYVRLITVPNSHAEGMLVVYLERENLLYTSDLYSAGRPTQHPLWSRELLNAIDWHDLEVDYLVGGHGQGAEPIDKLREFVDARQAPASADTGHH